jgi:hypothetical protein
MSAMFHDMRNDTSIILSLASEEQMIMSCSPDEASNITRGQLLGTFSTRAKVGNANYSPTSLCS